jgi:hypothetical protein
MRNIDAPPQVIRDFCLRSHIRKLSFFGSVLRDDFGPESDVDVLVEFEPGARVGLFELYDLEQEFSGILGGRRVEMNTVSSLSRYFRDEVLASAETAYVAA